MRRALVVVGLLVMACIAAPAAAQSDVDASLAAAREQLLYAQYAEAIQSVEAILARTDLAASQRNAALELLATAQIANRATSDARATLTTLYSRDPGHRLTDPDASPPVISAFARAREAQPTPVQVTLDHRSPGTLAQRESPSIDVRIRAGADAVEEVRLSYRHAGESGYTRVVMTRRADGSYTARIPVVGATDRAIDVAYFVTAVAPSGTELARAGAESEPLQLRIPAEAPGAVLTTTEPAQQSGGRSIAEEPAFWIVLGLVLAAGAGVTVGVVVATDQGPEQGTLGIVTLMH